MHPRANALTHAKNHPLQGSKIQFLQSAGRERERVSIRFNTSKKEERNADEIV